MIKGPFTTLAEMTHVKMPWAGPKTTRYRYSVTQGIQD